ncbi:MAG: hypothetical protein JEZ06_19740 [Anaerolineaceae bacterium]|nr:hypothetical protein [Anaerolineaceae bacterium]
MKPKKGIIEKLPAIKETQLELLSRLSDAVSVSGDESEVRKIVLKEIDELVDDIKTDAMGNVIAFKPAETENALTVLLAAHMDEIGFMIAVDHGEGLFQFENIGGIDVRQLPGKPVLIGKDKVPAVIGARAIHLTTSEERKRKIPLETLRFDTGGKENGGKIKPGDRAAFATKSSYDSYSFRGKAIDDRIGVATLIEILRNPPKNINLYAVFTTQEEVGLRGAWAASYKINPDIAIALDSTPANDFPTFDGEENTRYNTKLGDGPVIYTKDRMMLHHKGLMKHFFETAEAYEIPFQFRQPGAGGTDAGIMQIQREGIASLSISVPSRYVHTAIGLALISDWENTLKLVQAGLSELNPEVLES